MSYPNATGRTGPTVQPAHDQGLVPAQREDSEARGSGIRDDSEGRSATTSINAVGAQGMDDALTDPKDGRQSRAPQPDNATVTISGPGQGMDTDIGAPMEGTRLGSSKGARASGGSGRRGGAE